MLLSPPSHLCSLHWISPNKLPPPKTLTLIPPQNFPIQSIHHKRNYTVSAGRSKKNSGGSSTVGADVRREAKKMALRRSRKFAESLFYRLKNPNHTYADSFTEEELQMIGLGYDRLVRFWDKDDPNIRHPYDWYKYGEFGPYSWRGIVIGDPIRGRLSDERVSMIGEVRDHEEWEEIEQFEMAQEFSNSVNAMDKTVGFRYFWVFVRHPRWRVSELPWQQWTLVCEIVVEAGNKRLDKWNLMGRLGNNVRALITQCAAWMRPDIIYVKRPVYQCRFEPQDDFFKKLGPLLDPATEQNFLFELKRDDGRFETCTYFAGLCKIVKVNPKAFVDDVVKAYEKLDDEKKSKCLEFIFTNHPVELLHPYTREWKAKLEEMELGCDAPDDDEDYMTKSNDDDDDDDDEEEEDDDEEDDTITDADDDDENIVIDAKSGDEELGKLEENEDPEENENYWDEEFQKALRSPEAMEDLVKRSMEASTKLYKRQIKEMEDMNLQNGEEEKQQDAEVEVLNPKERSRPPVYKDEWDYVGYGRNRRRKIRKNKIPPELFLRGAVRPFTYKNLVKEIVLMRHAIVDGDISGQG